MWLGDGPLEKWWGEWDDQENSCKEKWQAKKLRKDKGKEKNIMQEEVPIMTFI